MRNPDLPIEDEAPERAKVEGLRAGDVHHKLAREREEAEGVEVFEDPDAVLPGELVQEGVQGEELLASDEWTAEEDELRES